MPVIFVGGAALATSGLAFFAFSDEQLGTWSFVLPLLVIYGIGRWVLTPLPTFLPTYLPSYIPPS